MNIKIYQMFLFPGLCLLVCFFLLPGIFSQSLHPDEALVVSIASRIQGEAHLNPETFIYPSLYFYLQALAYQMVSFSMALASGFKSSTELPIPIAVTVGRSLTVVCSLLTLGLTYKIADKLFGRSSAFWAGIFVGVSQLFVAQAILVTVDAPMAMWVALAFFLSVRIWQDGPSLRNCLGAGIAIGCAAGTKYTGLWALLPFCWACFFSDKTVVLKKWQACLIGLVAAVGTFLLTSPFIFWEWDKFVEALRYQQQAYAGGHPGQDTEGPALIGYLRALLEKMGWVPLLLFAGGGVRLLLKNLRLAGLLLVFPITYTLFLGFYQSCFERNLTAVLPFVGLVAGFALTQGMKAFQNFLKRPWVRVLAGSCLGLVLLSGLAEQIWKNTDKIGNLLLPETRRLARIWIEGHLPAGARIGLERYTAPLNPNVFQVVHLGYFGALRAELKGLDYLVVSSYDYERFFKNPERYPDQVRRYSDIFFRYALLKEFRPRPYVLSGPVIRIYHLSPVQEFLAP